MTALDQPAAVLALLRSAGRTGVEYADLRQRLGGVSAEPVLDGLRAAGHVVVRTPSDRGVLAVLIEAGA